MLRDKLSHAPDFADAQKLSKLETDLQSAQSLNQVLNARISLLEEQALTAPTSKVVNPETIMLNDTVNNLRAEVKHLRDEIQLLEFKNKELEV